MMPEWKLSRNAPVYAVLVVLAVAILTEPAYARRDRREGFNFGAAVQMGSGSDRQDITPQSKSEATIDSNYSTVNPYLGFVVGDYFNLGVAMGFDSQSSTTNEYYSEEGQHILREKSKSLKSISFFSRFLFAGVMFFEAGAGIYDQKVDVHNEFRSDSGGGLFSGKEERYSVRGLGTGYHLAGGFEIPIDNGFYMTVGHYTRVYNLRDFQGNGDLGSKVGRAQKREVTYGISHYVD